MDCNQAILGLAIDDKFHFDKSNDDLRFFLDVEVIHSGNLLQIFVFAAFTLSLNMETFWNSKPEAAPLVLIASGIIAFFNVNPYLLSFVE